LVSPSPLAFSIVVHLVPPLAWASAARFCNVAELQLVKSHFLFSALALIVNAKKAVSIKSFLIIVYFD